MKNRILKGLLMGSMIFAMNDGYSMDLNGLNLGSGRINFGGRKPTNPLTTNPLSSTTVITEIKEPISEPQTQLDPLTQQNQQKKDLNQPQSQPLAEQLSNSSKSKKTSASMPNPSSSKKSETVTNTTEVGIPSSTVTVKKTEVKETVAYTVGFLRGQCGKLYKAAKLYREIAGDVFNKSNKTMLARTVGESTIGGLLDLSSEKFSEFINAATTAEVRVVSGNLMNMNVASILNNVQGNYEGIKNKYDSMKKGMEKLEKALGGSATVDSLKNKIKNEVDKALDQVKDQTQKQINDAVEKAEDNIKKQIVADYRVDEGKDDSVLDLVAKAVNKSLVVETNDEEDFKNEEEASDDENDGNVKLSPKDSQNLDVELAALFSDDEFANPDEIEGEEGEVGAGDAM